jgi:hypothetical protein
MEKDQYFDAELELEARIFGKHLIGEEINAMAVSLYVNAHAKSNFEFHGNDLKLLKFILKYPSAAGMIDGGLALQKRDSVIRKKIFYMLAILETIPEYSRYFLSPKLSISNALEFLLFGIRGVFRMVLGYFFIRIL